MFFFFFQAEDGIRDLVRSRGLGDVYKRQPLLPDLPMELRLVMKEELVLVIALLPVVTTDGLAPEWELVM